MQNARWRWTASLAIGLSLGACGNTSRHGQPLGSASGGGGAGGGDPSSAAGTAGTTAGATNSEAEVVPGDMHRLNRFEYDATVSDVVGLKPPELQVSDGEMYGFDNNARVLGMHDTDFEQFYSAAGTVVHAALADAALRLRLLPCLHDGADCVARIIDEDGLRLFRRPLSAEEHAVYATLYTTLRGQSLSHDAALEKVLVALMSSAQFLYRMEFASTAGAEPLDGYEQATRLSYLLWSSAPDDALLEAARLDQLSQDAQLEQQLTRLWDDARSARFVQSFAGQWLGARRIAVHPVASDVSPTWTPALAAAAGDEVLQNFAQVLQQEAEFLDIFRGISHEIDAGLAPLYGLPPAAAGSRVTVSGERAGYLGSVGFLTLTSFEHRTSPSLRGRVVLDNLLCLHLPSGPVDEPLLDVGPPNTSLRAAYDSFRSTPACAACHQLFDPIGLALEHYDSIGQYRDAYASGEVIDSHVTLAPWDGHPDGLEVDGVAGVVERVVSDPQALGCAVEKLYTYATGDSPTDGNARNVEVLLDGWRQGRLSIKQLVRQLVLSKTFRYKLARTEAP